MNVIQKKYIEIYGEKLVPMVIIIVKVIANCLGEKRNIELIGLHNKVYFNKNVQKNYTFRPAIVVP